MILFYARKRYATCSSDDRLTTGSVGVEVVFHFSDDWTAAPARIAVFRGSGVSVDVALLEDSCTVPPEVLTQPGSTLTIGVYGTDAEGTVVIPTVYAEAGQIRRGAEPSGVEPTPQTQPLIDQLLAAANAARDAADEAERLAKAVKDAADAGEFDGEDGADGSGVWYTTARVSAGSGNPFVRRRDLIGREGATVQVHDLLVAPDVGDEGEPTTLYEITSVETACTLKRLCKIKGANGTDGASAYEIAVAHGYEGTEAEWLNSLHGADAVVDPTLSNPGEAADSAETGKVKHTSDYALTFAETLNSGAGIPLDAEWVVGDFGATRNYRAHSKRAVLNTSQCVLQAAAGYRFYVRTYSGGSYTDSNWYGPDYASRQTYTLPAGADVSVVVGAYPEDTSVTADPDVFGAAITIVNNIGSGGGGGSGITVDDALSGSSTNPVQNKVVKAALDGKGTYSKPASGIPKTDLAEDVQTSLDKANTALQDHQSLAAFRTAADQDAIDLQQNMAIAAKYTKPAGGIPASDLASAVQTSLGKADTALQSYTETDPTVPSWAKQSSKPSYTASEVGAVAVAQGVSHAGEFLVVGSDGNITTVSVPSAQGVNF